MLHSYCNFINAMFANSLAQKSTFRLRANIVCDWSTWYISITFMLSSSLCSAPVAVCVCVFGYWIPNGSRHRRIPLFVEFCNHAQLILLSWIPPPPNDPRRVNHPSEEASTLLYPLHRWVPACTTLSHFLWMMIHVSIYLVLSHLNVQTVKIDDKSFAISSN